jgi:hypothetical protein
MEISPMKLAFRGTLAAVAVGGLLVIGTVGSASAAQSASPLPPEGNQAPGAPQCAAELAAAKDNGVGNLRKLGDCEIDRRLVTITELQGRVAAAGALTDADRAALQSQLAADTSGLTALRAQVDGETDVTTLRADLKTIVTDFRIYVLMVPKTAEVIAADTELSAVTRLGTVESKLQARIDVDKAAGNDVTQAQLDLEAMQKTVAQVSPLVLGVPAAVLPLTLAQYNAGTAKPILASSRTSLRTGRGLLAGARADAVACRAALVALG